MNYRHAYHAGNFADVLKHAVLALIIEHLKLKPQPFRVIDLHAGTGLYDLSSDEAVKTSEWQSGIGRLFSASLDGSASSILAPYLSTVRDLNPGGVLKAYPGSPMIARALMRPGDQLVANELHPSDFELLKSQLRTTPGTKVLNLDSWHAVKSLLPPKERRGVVLIDPPFEATDEFERIEQGLEEGLKRFATGTYLVWFPVKEPQRAAKLLRAVRKLGLARLLYASLSVSARTETTGLVQTGILVINPPYPLFAQLKVLLPELSRVLATGKGAGFELEDLGQAGAG